MASFISALAISLGPLLGGYNSFKVLKNHARLATRAQQDVDVEPPRDRDGALSPTAQLRVDVEQNRKDTMDLLAYWVVFAVFLIFQHFVEPLISWLPFYDYGKMSAAIFLCIPETKGASYFFQTFVSPLLVAQESVFVEKVWPRLQKRLLNWVTSLERAVVENSVHDLSKDELTKSERDAQHVLDAIAKKRKSLSERGDSL